MDLTLNWGELITLLGRNGAGRSTTLKAIMGLVDQRSGSIMIRDHESIAKVPHHIAHLGIGYCSEKRGIFSSLSTEENLTCQFHRPCDRPISHHHRIYQLRSLVLITEPSEWWI